MILFLEHGGTMETSEQTDDMLRRLTNYECDGQITFEEYLWEIGYYMALPQPVSKVFQST